jgi:hypothetical protein
MITPIISISTTFSRVEEKTARELGAWNPHGVRVRRILRKALLTQNFTSFEAWGGVE